MTDKEKLITANMGYVVTLARQYKSDILSTDDLISEGSIGMMKAAEGMDSARDSITANAGYPFSS